MIVVDIETTGLDPYKNSIVSIGALDFYNSKNQFYEECKILDGAEVEPEALKINGFTLEQISDINKKSLKQILEEFLNWTEETDNRVLGGHNLADFDVLFLLNSSKKYKLNWQFGRRCVDLHSVCYTHHLQRNINPPIKDKKSNLNLDRILEYVELPQEPRPHHALTGAKMEAEAFSRLIYGKSLFEEYSQHKIPVYLKNDN